MLPAQEHGKASYYSNRLHGRRMSDGTRYHRDSLTCAHRSYPLGVKLKVTNIKNGKSVIVKVTDRCGSRRIDLSYAAAKQIDLLAAGVATVKVERYYEFKGVPFKPENDILLPEIDYEVTEGSNDGGMPEWAKAAETYVKSKTNSHHKPANKSKEKKKTPAAVPKNTLP